MTEEANAMDVDKAPAAADTDATTSDAAAADPASGDGTLHDQEGAEPAKTEEETDKEPEMVPPEVNPELLSQLKDMGFGHERAVRAIHFSGNSSLEGAINWVEEHAEDADIDDMLLVEKKDAKPKQKLTPEEAKARAADLQAKAKAKREASERQNAKVSEKLRIQMGKELTAAAKAEEEQKLKRAAEARRLEKEEEARARAKIQAKLDEDRRERRRKLGLPEELTEEEKAAERARAEEEAAREAAKRLPVRPVTKIAKMREILVQMKKASAGEEAKFKTCCKTLTAYCRNVYNNLPDEGKRSIKKDNKALNERVACMPGGLDFLAQVGFEDNGEVWTMPKGDASFEKAVLEGAGDVLDSAMNNPMFGVL